MRFYALDLRQEVHTRSARSLWALVLGLPPEAVLHRGTDGAWTDLHEMTAGIARALGVDVKRRKPLKKYSVGEFTALIRGQAKDGKEVSGGR